MTAPGASPDTIDLADIARSLRRGWKWIVGGLLVGGLIAVLVVAFGPRRFDAAASAIIRSAPEAGGSLLSKLGEAGGGAAALLAGGVSTPIETDIQILSSQSVVGAVVDSLLLQAEVRSPSIPATALLQKLSAPESFEKVTIAFERTAPREYRYTAGDVRGSVTAGMPLNLSVGVITLAESLPEQFTIRLFDRGEAIRRTSNNLTVGKAGGEVVRVAFRARDSISAAQVPNAVLVYYLARRRTDDRSANARRAEFLSTQVDSTTVLAVKAENELRRFQERSGLVDAAVIGKLELENAGELRKNLGALEVEQGALDQLLAQVRAGRMTARQLVAYPSFLKSPGINDLLRQLAELETERTKLLDRRLETDDEVVALTRSIANIEGQLVPLATAYSGALQRQRADLSAQAGAITDRLSAFPGAAQSSARLNREVLRLNQLSIGLQAQLVQARLSAISEGGDVRALDRAAPPKKVSFPDPVLTAGLGLGAGLLFGLAAALIMGAHGRYLDGPGAIERVVGIPAIRFFPGTPLLMSGRQSTRTLLLIPIEARTSTELVAARLADTALARGDTVTVLDFSQPTGHGAGLATLIADAENSAAFVVVRLPGMSSESTAALLSHSRSVLLVAPAGRIARRTLTNAVELLRRLEVPCAGVVLAESSSHAIAPV